MELQAMAKMAASYVNTTSRHVFLTGKAGTGKTTFLKYIVEHTHKQTVIAAPTGIAAINAGGVTLHSLLQLPFGPFIPENIPLGTTEGKISTPQTLFQNSKFNATKRQLVNEIELLIIDEVSMLRADLLDCIDFTLRHLRKSPLPFGGLQILFIGDLLQLPPVVKDNEKSLLRPFYASLFFFEARVLKKLPPVHVELNKIFRQQDETFIGMLNRIRYNQQTQQDLLFLNQYYKPEFNQAGESGYIYLTTHNHRADKRNEKKLQELDTKLHTFKADIEGTFPDSMVPTTAALQLKKDAQVMFIKNDPSGEGQFYNGKIGVVSALSNDEIRVRFEDGDEVLVTQYTWENKRYTLDKGTSEIKETYLGSFKQYPLKLAWAITIHKSQGLTFEKAILDLSGTFAPGQLYVALSRLTGLEGLVLSSPLPTSPPPIDKSLSEFNATTETEGVLEKTLKSDQKAYIAMLGHTVFDFIGMVKSIQQFQQSFLTDETLPFEDPASNWKHAVFEKTLKLQQVGSGFTKEIHRILHADQYIGHLSERLEKAKTYFIEILTPITEQVQSLSRSIPKDKKNKALVKALDDIEDALIKKVKAIEQLSYLAIALKSGGTATQSFAAVATQKLMGTKGKSKKSKTPTTEITYSLYKEGKGIQEIAEERGLVPGTIEGHLAQYVENGAIPITDLVEAHKVKQILELLKAEPEGLNEVKSQLPDDYSYGEIKLVIAHQKCNQN